MPSATPAVVAIVGRPNVGKSTLFNRFVGRRQSIVHDKPGVTRDRIAARAELRDDLTVELIDTGGLLSGDDDWGLNRQVMLAIEEADVVVLVVDGKEGKSPGDVHVAEVLRRTGKPVVLAVNKGDTKAAGWSAGEFHALGFGEPVVVSAEHALGIDALAERVEAHIPEQSSPAVRHDGAIAIVGRPNVGKSSLLNAVARAERVLVSERAGTTRDPIDTLVEHQGATYLLVDTAGIRRRSQVQDTPEEIAVMMARRQLERADLAFLVIDVSQGVTSGDLAIAGAIWEAGRAVIVACNKWDLLDSERQRERFEEGWDRLAEVLSAPPRVNLSATSGRGVDKLLPAATETLRRYRLAVQTAELNRVLSQALQRHHVPTYKGRPWRLLYASQVAQGPPSFLLFVNRVLGRGDSTRRYLENVLRRAYSLEGIPIRLVMRRRDRAPRPGGQRPADRR